jgi:hypothetical protein
MTKQTAVEWLLDNLKEAYPNIDNYSIIIDEAKEMEKEQIVNAWENCKKSMECKTPICQRKTGNGYFNKTFKNTENESR